MACAGTKNSWIFQATYFRTYCIVIYGLGTEDGPGWDVLLMLLDYRI